MGLIYPAVGFHFSVVFQLPFQTPQDIRFQEVSGFSQELTTEQLVEGGENRFTHSLPIRTQYGSLVLKRGLLTGSGLIIWVRNAINNLEIEPVDVYVSLLNELHVPVAAWHICKAYPVKWSYSAFNASENSLVTETLEMKFQYYDTITL